MNPIQITVNHNSTTPLSVISSDIICVSNGKVVFDRLALMNAVYEKLKVLNPRYALKLLNGYRYIGIDYRNLNELVKINKNINHSILSNMNKRKSGDSLELYITLKFNYVFDKIVYIIVDGASFSGMTYYSPQMSANSTPKIKLPYTKPYINVDALPVPSIDYLYKVVNSKFKATESCLKLSDNVALVPKCEKESISIVPVTKTIEDVVESIKAALLEGHTISSLIHGKLRTVRDIGICNMNTPMVIVKLKDNTFENLLIEQHTATSIGNMFTKEVKMSFA